MKWLNDAKGYGFITMAGGEDVFVHFSAIQAQGFRSLAEGASVEFDLVHQTSAPSAPDHFGASLSPGLGGLPRSWKPRMKTNSP